MTTSRCLWYAAKFRAETVCAEPPESLDPTDENLARICSNLRLARPATPDDFPGIRRALTEWDDGAELTLFETPPALEARARGAR